MYRTCFPRPSSILAKSRWAAVHRSLSFRGPQNDAYAVQRMQVDVRRLATATRPSSGAVPQDHAFFHYTSGRWLFNEKLRRAERVVQFDIHELHAAVQCALGRAHGHVKSMSKLAEGRLNRAFLLQMDDGFELIAKIPYPIAGPPFYATASEAATLKFLRSQGIPVPEVYGYCAHAENPVQSEYILLEKAPGVSVASQWMDLSEEKCRQVAHSMAEVEAKLFGLSFNAIGSLYFSSDVRHKGRVPLVTRTATQDLCIGPIADRAFWHGRRMALELDRGPWTDPEQYVRMVACKEKIWIEKYGAPVQPRFPHDDFVEGTQHPDDYVQTLENYLALSPHLLATPATHPFNQPTLLHPDLSANNIFVEPSTGRITCLIDWQHAIIQPKILAAGCRGIFKQPEQIKDPMNLVMSLVKRSEYASATPERKQAKQRDLHIRQLLFRHYRESTATINKPHQAVLDDAAIHVRQALVTYAGRPWTGDNHTLRRAVIFAIENWDLFSNTGETACPVAIDDDTLEHFRATDRKWMIGTMLLGNWRRQICGMHEDGWIRSGEYDRAKESLRQLLDDLLQLCEGDAEEEQDVRDKWKFQDHDEDGEEHRAAFAVQQYACTHSWR